MGRVRPTSGPRIATANPPTAANPAGLPALRGAGGPRRKARIDAWKPPVRPDRATASGPSAGLEMQQPVASGAYQLNNARRAGIFVRHWRSAPCCPDYIYMTGYTDKEAGRLVAPSATI